MSVKDKEKPVDNQWWQPALLMFGKMSAWIAVPILLGTFIGRWLDKQYNTEPWMLIGTVGVAFILSMIGLVFEATREYKKIEKEQDINEKDNE